HAPSDHTATLSCPARRSSAPRLGLDPLDTVLVDPELRGDDPADLDVEALRRPGRAAQAEQGLVELGADLDGAGFGQPGHRASLRDRKSTRLNSRHVKISYAVF